MKKHFLLITIFLSSIIIFCSCRKEPVPQQSLDSPKKEISFGYLSILGNSKNLTPKQKEEMDIWRKDIVEFAKTNKDIVYINGPRGKKEVALTFDDGPDGVITSGVLDILKAKNVNGSFFFIGKNIDLYPETVKRAFNEGNLVLNHSLNHLDLSKKNPEVIINEIKGNEEKIYSLINKRPAIVRPPFGAINQQEADQLKKLNCKVVIWSIDTLDWSQKDSSNITKNVLDNLRDGDIILMHSNSDKKATLEALPGIIEGIQNKGYSIVTLDKLLNINPYK